MYVSTISSCTTVDIAGPSKAPKSFKICEFFHLNTPQFMEIDHKEDPQYFINKLNRIFTVMYASVIDSIELPIF